MLEHKIALEIDAQRRLLAQPVINEWKKPSAIIPAVTALVSVIGLVIQSIVASYSAKNADIDRKMNELRVAELRQEIASKTVDVESLTLQITTGRAETQRLQAEITMGRAETQRLQTEITTARETAGRESLQIRFPIIHTRLTGRS